jgi:hypothetical protein
MSGEIKNTGDFSLNFSSNGMKDIEGLGYGWRYQF